VLVELAAAVVAAVAGYKSTFRPVERRLFFSQLDFIKRMVIRKNQNICLNNCNRNLTLLRDYKMERKIIFSVIYALITAIGTALGLNIFYFHNFKQSLLSGVICFAIAFLLWYFFYPKFLIPKE
jgi:hypothetical protein